jgi:hypothetical protein
MQEPNENDEAPIPTEIVSNGPNLNRAVKEGRKAAKRTLPWDLAAGELDLVSPQPRAEDIPARKKRRLEEPFSASTEEAASTTASPSDVSVGLPPPAADSDDANVNAEPVMDTQPDAGGATRATRRWTLQEDARLTTTVANTSKKKWGKEYKTDWATISALIPGRTAIQSADGMMSWIRTSAKRVDEEVNGQQSKTASSRMRYKRTVTRIGLQLPC